MPAIGCPVDQALHATEQRPLRQPPLCQFLVQNPENDYQFVVNPAYNRDRGPVSIGAIRLHSEF